MAAMLRKSPTLGIKGLRKKFPEYTWTCSRRGFGNYIYHAERDGIQYELCSYGHLGEFEDDVIVVWYFSVREEGLWRVLNCSQSQELAVSIRLTRYLT